MSTTAAAGLPPVRRIITGHTSDGKAVFADDAPASSYPFAGSTTVFTDLYRSDGFPASNDGGFEDAVKHRDNGLVNPNGSVFRAVDVPPRTESVLHRTVTLDYGILMNGTLTLVLDDNKRAILKPGDVVVQRGTIHAWVNETDEWARAYFVLLPTNKVKAGEKELGMEFKPLPEEWKATVA
ncbi:uncharacterized protein PHACADRAFT_260922 [Phanerochaete carnosa HHB-10118-sp]|uniref:Cupin type-2 domain-containing protein n=1 Tax=Phanerochaete carnosa (strain HHB-10118-sp) TaxID=650164 RepID=K5W067_PHACS|nr:uncharacterized protein PHACADRAFT_260922 [Phanerochaete carnosa HHB-10118-sp]EKM52480.1 hypothetical protein PHACADRAFT_260922 [Phanerochaete carnosa HHB-10118-sp]